MIVSEALRSHLTATAGLIALTSSRIYTGQRFQAGALPAVNIWRLAQTRPVAHDPGNVGRVESMFQFDIWGSSLTSTRAVEAQLRRALESFPGVTGYDAKRFHMIRTDGEDFSEEPAGVYRTIMSASCWHTDD